MIIIYMPRKELTKKELENYMKANYGEGIFSDAYDWIKNKASEANKYLKKNQTISKGLASYAASNPTSKLSGPAYVGSLIAEKLGYGENLKPVMKKKTVKKKRGGARTKLEMGLLP